MCITGDLGHFVNRDAEIEMFSELLADTRRRALLLHGPPGIGKSCIIHRLYHIYRNYTNLSTALIDFRRHHSRHLLSEVDEVIWELCEQTGVKIEIPRRMYSSDQFPVHDETIGKNQLTPSPVIIDTAIGRNLHKKRRNREFRKALRRRLKNTSVILFFDHFEDATPEIKDWIQNYLLNLLQRDGFRRLWFVIAGRDVPQQKQDEAWRFVHSQEIGPLTEDAMRLFWVEKCQLDPDRLMEAMEQSGGNPGLLVMIAKSHASSIGRAQASE